MDIISFSQGKKAQKEVLKLQKDMGNTAATKHGSEDVKGTFENVDKRLEDIEFKLSPGETNKMISDATKKTMINLMKQQFKVDAIMQSRKEAFENMAFDSFLDDTGIDKAASKNVTYDNKGLIKQTNPLTISEVVMKAITTQSPINQIRVSLSYNEILSETQKVDKTKISYDRTKILFDGNSFKLDMTDLTSKEVEIESETIDLGMDYKNINAITINGDEKNEAKIRLLMSESNDGKIFDPYYELSKNTIVDKKTKRFIKIKAVLKSGYHLLSSVDSFTAEYIKDRFYSDSISVDIPNAIILKNTIKLKMTPIEPIGNGINKITINKNDFKEIESVKL